MQKIKSFFQWVKICIDSIQIAYNELKEGEYYNE